MRQITMVCFAGALISALGAVTSVVSYTDLNGLIENIEATEPVNDDKIVAAIARVVPDTEQGKAAVNIVRHQIDETRTFHGAWLQVTKLLQRSKRLEAMIAFSTAMLFLVVLVLVRRHGSAAREL